MIDQIIEFDKKLFLILNNLGTPAWDGFWLFISDKYNWIPLYLVLAILLYRNYGLKRTALIIGLSLLMILVTDQITNLFKDGFQRLRPCHVQEFDGLMRGVDCEGRGRYGFTSAHASNHFAIAVLLGSILKKKIKWLLPLLLVWAGFIAYSRIYLGVHFPLDVFCGSIMGLFFGIVFFKLYLLILKKYPKISDQN